MPLSRSRPLGRLFFRLVMASSRSGSPAAGFRPPAGGRVTFLCLPTHAQERVRTAKPARRAEGRMPGVKKSNHRDGGNAKRNGTPDDAPSGLSALQVRGRAPGFFARASCPGEKLARIHAGHPAGFSSTRPPLSYGDPTEPRAEANAKAKARSSYASASTRPSPP